MLRKSEPWGWSKDEALELLRVLASREHGLFEEFGSLPSGKDPNVDIVSQGCDAASAIFRIFRRENVDGEKLFGTSAARPPSAKTFNRLVLDTKLKGWGVKDAACRTLVTEFCHLLCQAHVRLIFDISDERILASEERIDLLVYLATQTKPAEGDFRYQIAHKWREVRLAAATNLVEVAEIERGRRLMMNPACRALAWVKSILDQACTQASSSSCRPSPRSASASTTSPLEPHAPVLIPERHAPRPPLSPTTPATPQKTLPLGAATDETAAESRAQLAAGGGGGGGGGGGVKGAHSPAPVAVGVVGVAAAAPTTTGTAAANSSGMTAAEPADADGRFVVAAAAVLEQVLIRLTGSCL